MSNGRLILQPPREMSGLSRATLLSRLRACEMLGAPYRGAADAWLVGEGFLRQIAFLGCSPHLMLEPPYDGGTNFCHLRLRGPYPAPRLLSATNSRTPRCPACASALTHWRQLQPAWSVGLVDQPISCRACAKDSLPGKLNWRRSAGVGTLFIEIWGIYPEEAIPQPSLLEALGGTGGGWRRFYLMD